KLAALDRLERRRDRAAEVRQCEPDGLGPEVKSKQAAAGGQGGNEGFKRERWVGRHGRPAGSTTGEPRTSKIGIHGRSACCSRSPPVYCDGQWLHTLKRGERR